jgi:acetyl-CoA C-acetyltransferase
MALDCYKQVAGKAGDYQVDGVKNAMSLNVGGTLTTVASVIIGRD